MDALEQHCEEQGYLTHGSVTGGIVRIATNKATARAWDKFCKNKKIQAYCQSDQPDVILNKLMEECEIEWMSRAEDAATATVQPVEAA